MADAPAIVSTATKLVKPFLTDEQVTHDSFQVAKNSRKKMRLMDPDELLAREVVQDEVAETLKRVIA